MAGFFSKWFLATGGLDVGQSWVIAVLVLSSLLNAFYFLPVLRVAWFATPPEAWPEDRSLGRRETSFMLLLPTLASALMALGSGLLASVPLSPLQWARLIASLEYGP